MFSRRLKTGYFLLEGTNSFATIFYFYYFYFFMQKHYGFDNKANLVLAALSGGVYAVCSFVAGKVAQRVGYFNALKLGFLLMLVPLAAGLALHSAAGQITVMLLTVAGMSLIWPTLEALVSEGELAGGVQKMVGVYNVVWAATAALANFCGGAILENLGPASLFYVPSGIVACQLGLTFWFESQARRTHRPSAAGVASAVPLPTAALALAGGGGTAARSGTSSSASPQCSEPSGEKTAPERPRHGKSFLNMAWLANPFAYIAINTVIATMPGVASRLHLSTMLAGFCCSVWCFARLGAFWGLWVWNGWHYRFRWLLLAFVTLVVSFAAILLTPSLWGLIVAQIGFGSAVGLFYSSSLFYSMDQSDTKSEHGGIHEAAIGLGNCAGPAVGAAALQFLPQQANSGAAAVTVLLVGGLGGLLVLWRKGRKANA